MAVIPWIVSRCIVVTTVTPVANRPMTWRRSRAAFSAAAERGVSFATPVGVCSPTRTVGGFPCGGFDGGGGRRSGGISPSLSRGLRHPGQTRDALSLGHDRGRVFSGS